MPNTKCTVQPETELCRWGVCHAKPSTEWQKHMKKCQLSNLQSLQWESYRPVWARDVCVTLTHAYGANANGAYTSKPSTNSTAYTGTEVLGWYIYTSFKKSCFTLASCSNDKALHYQNLFPWISATPRFRDKSDKLFRIVEITRFWQLGLGGEFKH